MSELDPGLVIVVTVLISTLAMLGIAWRRRRRAQALMASLREGERLELDVVSTGRQSAALGGPLLAIIFAVPFVAMGLGEWGRVFNSLPNAWFRVGRVSLDGDTLRLESGDTHRQSIDLGDDWELAQCVAPGQRTEVVLDIAQGSQRLTLRYPLLMGDDAWAANLRVVAPAGIAMGPETRVLHERLRDRVRAAAERVD